VRITLAFCLAILGIILSGCSAQQWNGVGRVVGEQGGAPVYQTDCKIDTSIAGQKGLFGTGTISPIYACEGQAKASCPTGYRVIETVPGARRQQTQVTQAGTMVTRKRYIEQDLSIRYQCAA
jgi:hypothetical protein